MINASICCLHFECMNICVWAFPLCCYYFFCLCYCKMSVPIFSHVVFWHFTSCLHIRRTQLFICLRAYFFCFLELNMQLLACLIFDNRFVHCFIAFFLTIVHIFIFLFSAGSCRCHFVVFGRFLFLLFDFFCTPQLLCP